MELAMNNNETVKHSAKQEIKIMVRGSYDVQALRIQHGNRIVANFKAKLGQAPSTKEEDMDKEEQKILNQLRADYKKITDGVKIFPKMKTFKGTELISSYTELCLLEQYESLESQEAQHFRRLGGALEAFPIYTEYLEKIRGVGPAMAGVIISELDPHKAHYASGFQKYCGLDVVLENKDGAIVGHGRSKKKEDLVDWTYTDKEGKEQVRKGITFNPFVKTKLVGVLAGSFIRLGNNKYETLYRGYKNRLENMPEHAEKTKGHRERMAKRYIIKIFLIDLWTNWRKIEGLPVTEPYHSAKLGLDLHDLKPFFPDHGKDDGLQAIERKAA